MRRILFAVLCLFATLDVFAASRFLGGPTPGIWWNAAESGRGYQIDLQGDIMVVTTYGFGQSGAPIWYISAGLYNKEAGTFQATFDNTENGQCFGCTYRAPTPRPNAGGSMRIVFDSYVTGTLYFNGGSTRIQRQLYAYPQPLDFLFGEFVLSTNTNGIVLADWPVFGGTYTSGGVTYASGNQDGSSQPALGRFVESARRWLVLIRNGSYDHYYDIDMDDRRVFGRGWVVPVNANISGNGVPAVGFRLLMRSELTSANLVAPADKAMHVAGNENDALAHANYLKSATGEPPQYMLDFVRDAKAAFDAR